MTKLIGRTFGQYRITEKVGQGGMATVYKVYQPGLNRYVAMKILPPIHAEQPGFSERFQREAEAIANLNHQNILPVYDSGQEGDYSFIVMRYVEGARTLKEVMAGSLGLSQVVDLIGQVAAALDYAHRQGVIHRDVKPSNVLVDGDWALLTDFGLAKMTEASVKLTGTGVGIGTPAYMSPEQGQGQPVDHRTDIYALGVVLFEMLTGQIPHNAETPVAIVFKRATEPLPLPRTLNPAIPEAVERVVLKALAPEPEDRFASAGALAAALKEAVSGDGAQAFETPPLPDEEWVTVPLPETSPPPPAPAWSALPWKWIAGIGGLVIVVAVLFFALVGKGGPPPTPTATLAAASVAPTDTPVPTVPTRDWELPEHLAVIWDGLEEDSDSLGTPGTIHYRSNYSRQPFEGGFMLWWDNPDGTDYIWVLEGGDDADSGDNWSRYDNTWTPDYDIFPPDCPDAQEPYGPMMGFGKTWCDYPSVKDALGKALEKEFASNNAVVHFSTKGVRFYFPAYEEIWVLYYNGTWKSFD